MIVTYTEYNQLPLTLNAADIAKVLGISRSGAYNLLHRKDFPTILIGKRLLVSRDKFLEWMEQQVA